jgi:hypothetical protein
LLDQIMEMWKTRHKVPSEVSILDVEV